MEVRVIYSCNEQKERASFRLIMVSSIDAYEENMLKIQEAYNYTDEELESYTCFETVELNVL